MRRAHGRVGARVDGRGVRRCCRTRRSGRSRGDRRRRSARRSRAGTSSSRPVSSTRAQFTWRAAGESFLAGVRGGVSVIRAAVDVSPLVQTRAGTARHVRGLLAALAGRDGSRGGAALVRRSGQGGVGGAGHVVVLRRAAALRTRARTAPLHDLPRPAAGVRAVHGHAPRPRARPASGALPALAPALRPRRDRPSRAGGGPGLRRLRVHEARGDRAARRRRRARGRDRERDRAGLHARRAGRRGRVRARGRDAGAAQESPPDRRRRGAGRRRAARRRRARLGWASRRRAGSARSTTTSSPRSTAAPVRSSSPRCTRGSASPCSRRWRPARRW